MSEEVALLDEMYRGHKLLRYEVSQRIGRGVRVEVETNTEPSRTYEQTEPDLERAAGGVVRQLRVAGLLEPASSFVPEHR